MKYLLDTNMCIYIIKNNPLSVLKKFEKLSLDDVGISSVTLAELRYGVEKSHHQAKNRHALQKFILPLEILPFDEQATHYYGILRAYLEKKGTPIGALDMMIASHAQSLQLTLVTNNTKEFSRVPKLSIEDWTKT